MLLRETKKEEGERGFKYPRNLGRVLVLGDASRVRHKRDALITSPPYFSSVALTRVIHS